MLEKLLAKHGVRGAIQNHSLSNSTLSENGGLKYLQTWMTLQDGMLDKPLVLRLLKESGYTGSICLNSEYRAHYCRIENSVERTNAVAKTDLDYLRKEVARL